jgi:hypothetical protein
MLNKLTNLLPVSALLLLAGCPQTYPDPESNPFNSVPVGSSIQLNQSVEIPGEKVAVFLQDGVIKTEREVDFYKPNCKFEVYKMSEQPRVVDMDTFSITRIVDEIESSSIGEKTTVAAMDSQLAFTAGLYDRSLMFNYATKMYLHSDTQPDVYRMTCQHWESLGDNRYVSIAQMRQAMGQVFTLLLKSEPTQ